MADRALFVDFMYAVAVGTALPRLDEKALYFKSPLLWGLLFMVAVFLEDFFLYHVKVVPHLKGFPSARGFILAMLIIVSWYLSQAAFPSNPRLFLLSFGLFFLLKWLGGVLMRTTAYPSRIDTVFALPILAAFGLAFFCDPKVFASRPGRLLIILVPVWLLTVTLWWSLSAAADPAPSLSTH